MALPYIYSLQKAIVQLQRIQINYNHWCYHGDTRPHEPLVEKSQGHWRSAALNK